MSRRNDTILTGILKTAIGGVMLLSLLLAWPLSAFGQEELEQAGQLEQAEQAEQVEQELNPPPSPEEVELAVQDVDEAVQRFTTRAREFQDDIAAVVETYYEWKNRQIDERYEKILSKYEAKEYELILDAIEQLEYFLARFPNTPPYTPDAMFRLAELHYQKAKREYVLVQDARLREYEKQLTMFDEGLLDVEPQPPHPEYTRSIELYNQIARDFPDYRYIDSVYYLLAYCYQEEGDLPGVRGAFEDLIATKPDSKYVTEAYLRIGDAYFNEFNYPPALEAFETAATYGESDLYDQILYKLASTYFILDRFGDAIGTFARLNDYSETMLEKEERHSYFRDESIKYIAYCYAQGEEYWPGAGVGNALIFFNDLGERPWESDVFRELGDYFVQQTKWGPAVSSYKRAIDRNPFDPGNPQLQDKIIRIYAFGLRDQDAQNVERGMLAKNYGESSEWAQKNTDNPDALKEAHELVQNSLRQWAYFQHAQAQKYRQLGKDAEAKVFYGRAAESYSNFLKQFPHDREAYELTFRLAESYFFSGDYVNAVDHYGWVRDSKLSRKYFQDAAYSVVLCYDNMIGKSGVDLTMTEEQAAKQQRERLKGMVEPQEIPELKMKYIEAGDFYVNNTTKPLDQEKIAWNTAEIYFENNHLEPARDRYMDIVNRFPKSEVAVKAARRVIDTYYVTEDWVKVSEWSEKLASLALGSAETREKMRAELMTIKGNAMAQYAAELEQRKEYEKAAEQYLKAVRQEPKSEQAPMMLYNAAVNYSRAKRPAKAMELFQRMVDEYPKAEFAAESLYLVAENAYDSFNLGRASKAYAQLYANYPDIKPKRKCLAIYNHAQLKEFDHEYRAAAKIYERYSLECAAVETDAPIILFRAGVLFEKMEDWNNMNRVYNDFVDRFGRDKRHHRFVVQAYFKIGQAFDKRGKTRDADRYFNKAIDFFLSHPEIATDFLANSLAAQSKFTLNEREYDSYRELGISARNEKAMLKSAETKQQSMNEMIRLYEQVKQFKSPEYFLASSYRMAEAVELFADSLFEAPVPKKIEKLGDEYVFAYQQALADKARPLYEQAAQAYLKAFEVGKKTKLFASPWMKRIINALNRPNLKSLTTQSVSIRKQEKPAFAMETFSALPLDNGKPHEPIKPENEATKSTDKPQR